MKSLPAIISAVFIFSIGCLHAQQIDSLLRAYDNKVPQEKIHIHFDNSLYTPGQTVWYKAYLLKGNEPSHLSKNVYIEWFDEKGKMVDRIIAPVVGSTASGSFTVPAKYAGTQLQVLAYTKWMLNFDSAFLFHKNIPVAQSIAQNSPVSNASVTTLRFFPEGGDLIENISSTIAFKAQKTGGMPADVSGIITDKNGKQVVSFSSVHNGMGKFAFTPVSGEAYTAEWTDATGNKRYTALPSAKTNGLVLSINTGLLVPEFTIERSQAPDAHFTKGSIVAQINQHVVFRAGIDMTLKTKISSSLPVKDLPSGILQVTVFDIMHRPLAERMVFINNDNYLLPVNINIDTVDLGKRGKNVYRIQVPEAIKTSLSLSVTDGEIKPDSSTNIISQLLLSGEIKGYLHDPAYYFSSASDSSAAHLDLVMLTNGWRRFKWEDVWSGKTPSLIFEPDTNYLSISGKIEDLKDRKIRKAETVNLVLFKKDSTTQYIFTPLHTDGSFGEENLILFDTTKVFYRLNKVGLPGKSHIKIRNSFIPFDSTQRMQVLQFFLPDTLSIARIQFIANEQKQLDLLKSKTTLQEVIVKTTFKTRLEQLDQKYATGQFSGHSTTIYELNVVDDTLGNTATTMIEYLRDKLRGFRVDNGKAHSTANYGFLLDEETHLSFDEVSRIPVGSVAYIKAWPTSGMPGDSTSHVIVIYTKKGKDVYINNDFSGLSYVKMLGYTPVKEFYSPDHSEQANNIPQADLRRTLYWKPNIQTGSNDREIKISFYNNDVSHSLRIILEGIAADGRLIHINKFLN